MCFRSHSRSKLSKHHVLLDKDAMPRQNVKLGTPCHAAGDELPSEGYCKDCKEYLCSICYRSHARSKLSRHHVLEDMANMQEDSVKTHVPEDSDHAVTSSSSVAKMNINAAGAGDFKSNEECTYIRDINIKANADEKDCRITGMVLISNTELVLCDYNNACLNFADVENNIINYVLVLQSRPSGITALSNDQVAVVLENKYKIQIISVSENLSVVRTIKTNGYCGDVELMNGKLYVSFWYPVKFQILQTSGGIIKTIKPDSEVLKHCSVPGNIAISPDESLIYVSDWKTNKVLSMDMDGNMIFMYHGELEKPEDITFLSRFVYLCNSEQNILYKITSDLSEAAVIIGPGGGLYYPRAMCFNTDKHHLYTSTGSRVAKYNTEINV